jgi:hypothetical protein
MQAKTVGNMYGPGPCLALMYRKNALPKKMKTAMITVGYSNFGRERWIVSSLGINILPLPGYTRQLPPEGM